MHSSFGMLGVTLLLAILGCQNDDSGSSVAALDLGVSCWGCIVNNAQAGSFTPDSTGVVNRFQIVFELHGTVADGSYSGTPRFRGLGSTACTGKLFSWAGTLRGSVMTATMQGNSDDVIEVRLEFTDDNTATGTYEYVETSTACLGETGVIELTRTVPI